MIGYDFMLTSTKEKVIIVLVLIFAAIASFIAEKIWKNKSDSRQP